MKNLNKSGCTHKVSIETRGEGEMPKIVGYAAKFNQRSRNMGGFVEIISPGAFDDVLEDDVRGLFNHDSNIVLGRTISGTCQLTVDDIGLRYEITPPDTQTVRDLVIEPIKRGDINGSSFAFQLRSDGQSWDEDDDGVYVRTISKVARLKDVSPVTYPAYDDTDSAVRSLEDYKRSKQKQQEESQDLARMREQTARDRHLQTL